MEVDEVNSTLIKKCMIDCPLCGELHLVERRTRTAIATIKGEKVKYTENYFVCENSSEDENEFITSKVMDENLLAARDAYRTAHGMFTSKEIVALRNRYNLTQRELAKMLGWGEATVSRYESKQIQDETYDAILQTISNDAYEAKQYLIRNRNSFEEARYQELMALIEEDVQQTSGDYLTRKLLESKYSKYQSSLDLTGGIALNLDKVCNMASYFASNCIGLFKVKLMKLLWYSDAYYYSKYGYSMSGLVYQHKPMGALPVGHYELMALIPHEECYDDFERCSFKILPTYEFNESVFSMDELEVLRKVLNKFGSYSGKDLADYMHKEIAYVQTADNAYIPYSLASKISI